MPILLICAPIICKCVGAESEGGGGRRRKKIMKERERNLSLKVLDSLTIR